MRVHIYLSTYFNSSERNSYDLFSYSKPFLNILAFIILMFSSCKKNDAEPANDNKQANVYAAGYNDKEVVYWKNGEQINLASFTNLGGGEAADITISNNDVYVAGFLQNDAVYWKNGKLIKLSDGYDFKFARAIAVNGNDVYVVGEEGNNNTGQNAVLWKNGVKTILSPLLGNQNRRVANAIKIIGNDVYIAGTLYDTAVYWKNGVQVTLATGHSQATDIAIDGDNVYVTGIDMFQAVYWKNKQKNILSNSQQAISNSIFINGSDIYMAGVQDNKATYWRNGEPTVLQQDYSEATSIAIAGNDIYVVGNISSATDITSVLWTNNIQTKLAYVSDIPTHMAKVNAIAVSNN